MSNEPRPATRADRAVTTGAAVAGVSGLVLAALVAASDLPGAARIALGRRVAPGRLAESSVGGWSDRHMDVARYRFTFRTPDGRRHSGLGFGLAHERTGPPPGAGLPEAEQPAVTVEYADGHPGSSRIKGSRLGPLPLSTVLDVLAPPWLAGLAAVVAGRKAGGRTRRGVAAGLLVGGPLLGEGLGLWLRS